MQYSAISFIRPEYPNLYLAKLLAFLLVLFGPCAIANQPISSSETTPHPLANRELKAAMNEKIADAAEPSKSTSQNQTITIKGVNYATGVKLGLPIPVLIRAKALSEKLTSNTAVSTGK